MGGRGWTHRIGRGWASCPPSAPPAPAALLGMKRCFLGSVLSAVTSRGPKAPGPCRSGCLPEDEPRGAPKLCSLCSFLGPFG